MEFKKLVKQLNALNLPKDQYVVVASGALAACGIREANDFDVLVTQELWEKLARDNKVEIAEGVVENINFGSIQILGNGSSYRKPGIADVQEIITTADIFQGHNFMNLELLRKFKQRQGREKDLRDVELIVNYLTENGRF